ncbi:MAG TPA: sigma factor, partial [Hymenobacter sp.]
MTPTYTLPSELAPTPLELELIRRMTVRDETVMTLFYERYGAMLYRVILRLVKHPVLAESVFQESLITIWHSFPNYDASKKRLFCWALGVCRNRALEELHC